MAKTILIADDNYILRQVVCEALTREGDFEVCGQAQNGQDAIEKAQQLHPDLIILVLSMPVMDGLDAARTLKNLMPSMPIILFHAALLSLHRRRSSVSWVAAAISKSEHISVLMGQARGLLYRNAA